jgi:hypothetical protein
MKNWTTSLSTSLVEWKLNFIFVTTAVSNKEKVAKKHHRKCGSLLFCADLFDQQANVTLRYESQ